MTQKNTFSLFFLALFLLSLNSDSLASTSSLSTNSKATIIPTLELSLSEQGQSEVRFGNVQSGVETEPAKIRVDIRSNIPDSYQVTQLINGPLVNQNGDQITVENLKFKTVSLGDTGTPVSAWTPTSASTQVIFTSSAEGTSEKIEASYLLTIPSNQPAGDYSASITYTVSAI